MKNENRIISILIYFILIVTPLLFFTDLTRNPYYTQISLLHIGLLLIPVVFLISALIEGRIKLPRTPLDAPIMAFLAVAAVSLIVSFIKHPVSYFRYSLFSEGLNRYFFTVVNCVLAYYAAYYYVNKANRNRYLVVSLIVGAAAAVYGIMQYFGIEFIWPKTINPFGVRSVSTFGNPNFLSSYLVMLLPVALGFFLISKNKTKRFLFVAAAVIFTGSILATLTRSSWAGAVAAIFTVLSVLFAFNKDFLKKNITGISLFLVILLLAVVLWPKGRGMGYDPTVRERMFEIGSVREGVYHPIHQRLLIWKCSWDMLESHPILGVGWGAMELFYPFYQGRMLFDHIFSQLRTHANNSHNEILEILSQVGLAGFGIYLWFLACVFCMFFKLLKFYSQANPEYCVIVGVLGAAVAGMLVDNLLNVSLHFAVPAFLYWWFLGIAAGFASEGSGEKSYFVFDTANPKIKFAVVFAAAFCIFLVYRTFRYQLNQVYFFRGFKLSQQVRPGEQSDAVRVRLLRSAESMLAKAHGKRRFEVNNNYELGNIYARLRNNEKAVWAYREALNANAGYDEIYYNLASIFYQTNELDKALKYFRISNFINPINKETYTGLSNIYIKQINQGVNVEENQRHLEELFKIALSIYPKERDFWNNLGYVYISTKRYEEAVKAYEQTLKIDPGFKAGRDNLLFCLNNLGIKSHPLLEIDENLSRVLEYINAGNLARAKKTAEEILSVSPEHPLGLMYMGNILFNENEFLQAADFYGRALELSPDNISVLANLGITYIMLKEYDKSRRFYGRITELTKDRPGFESNYRDAAAKLEELRQY